MAKKQSNDAGKWAFVIALALAVLLGAFQSITLNAASILVLLGLVVGLMNVTQKETRDFMLGGTVLIIVSSLGSGEISIIPSLGGVFQGLLLVFVPATAIVALKEMYQLARR